MPSSSEIDTAIAEIIVSMRDHAMGFAEGYLVGVEAGNLETGIDELKSRADRLDFSASLLFADQVQPSPTDAAGWLDLYRLGAVSWLQIDVAPGPVQPPAEVRLMIEPVQARVDIEVLIASRTVLASPNPDTLLRAFAAELFVLRRVFGADAAFLGPETLDYPASAADYPSQRIRLAARNPDRA
jgi:hypothetical protein